VNVLTYYAFLDELEKIAQVGTEVAGKQQRSSRPEAGGGALTPPKEISSRTSTRMDVPRPSLPSEAGYKAMMASRNSSMPSHAPPVMSPPKPPIGERVKSLASRGAPIIKNIEKIITKPMAPHRYAGVAYRRDFSGFKYS
jgi:hypothetical protein